MAGASDAATYLPDVSVTTVRSTAVASLRMVTETPGIAAFCGSTMVPSGVAVDWAPAMAATNVNSSATKISLTHSPSRRYEDPPGPYRAILRTGLELNRKKLLRHTLSIGRSSKTRIGYTV